MIRSVRALALVMALGSGVLVTMSASGISAPNDTSLVSLNSSGEQGNEESYWASISADGRHVAFGSWADNLVEGDTNGVMDIFVRDLHAGTTQRVSVDSSGNQQNGTQEIDGDTLCGLDISADGRYVAFSSAADNLVPHDTNGLCDVFVRDLQAGTTERVSVHDSGEQANGGSWSPSISADGRYVAFHSEPDNLVGKGTLELDNVYVRDLQADRTERASVDVSGNPIGGEGASISADGRYVAFVSGDVYVRDLQANTTKKASVSTSGRRGNSLNRDAYISAGGRYVVFSSQSDNLVEDDTNGETDVFVRDLREKTTRLVSVDSSGEQADSYSFYPSISADGRYVTFESTASNLVPDSNGGMSSIYLRDLRTGKTRKISVDSSGNQANGEAFNSSISDDGRYVAFSSYADNLVGNDSNGTKADVFLHELPVQNATEPDTTHPTRPEQDVAEPDTTPPTANIVTPASGAVYARGLEVGADYSCEDEEGGTGLKSCRGTVAQGHPIDTGSLGTKTFTVRPVDNAGNTSSATSSYIVAQCSISGTSGDDVLEGTAGPDRICGLDGNDTVNGSEGDDELVGGAGNDSLNGGSGIDTAVFEGSPERVTASLVTNQATGDGFDLMMGVENLAGSNYNDVLIGSGAKNDLLGRSGVDQLFGLEGGDTISGGTQDDTLVGGAGDDHVVANGGSDDLFGEEGDDSLDSRDGTVGNDSLNGGTGSDACLTEPTEESITGCE